MGDYMGLEWWTASFDEVEVGDKVRQRTISPSGRGLYLVTGKTDDAIYLQPIHGTDRNRCKSRRRFEIDWEMRRDLPTLPMRLLSKGST